MKTEIIESYQTYEGTFDFRKDFMIVKVLPISNYTHVILKKRLSKEEVIEIRGNVNKTIQISSILPATLGINFTSIFPFKNGFGYMDHINSKLVLWDELEGEPIIINVLKSESLDLTMRKECIAFVTHDNSDNTLLLGINDNKGPAEIARYWTILQLPELTTEYGTEINLEWNSVQDLNPEFYPKTYYNHQYPTLEWLNINDIVKIDTEIYCYTTGGSRTRMKSGPEYEFSFLSKIDNQNQVVKNIEVEKGKGHLAPTKNSLLCGQSQKKTCYI